MQSIQDLTRNSQHLNGSSKLTTALEVNNTNHQHQSSKANTNQFNALVVWRKFTEFYGSAWLSEFGEQPNQSWIEELAQLSPRDIETGLNQCKRSGSNFAPRLPQFLAYCVPVIVDDVYRHERETYQRLSLPKPKSSAEVRKAAMAQIRAELKILVTPIASKEELGKRQAAMIEAAEFLMKQEV